MSSPEHRHPYRPVALSVLATLGTLLVMPAMAQQTPLTGRMLGNQPKASASTSQPRATAETGNKSTSVSAPRSTQAKTYPVRSSRPAPGTKPDASPAPPPMPGYTDMRTAPPAPAMADATMASPPAAFGTPIGGTTEHLLRMQADNSQAAAARPMLGDEADAAYQRYIDSFKHPIPVFFQTMVENGSGSGSSGSGQ